MKKRFTEEQIIGFLKEADAGVAIKDLCRRHGFSEASYYLWRSKFGGMDVSDAKRLKALEAENAKLKKLLAEAGSLAPRNHVLSKPKLFGGSKNGDGSLGKAWMVFLSLESSDLPGIAVVKISGAAPTTEWLGHYPVGAVGNKMEEIDDKKNHIPRLAAVPRIPTGNPFDPVLTLTGIQTHLNQDLVSMKLVDPVFASRLDRSLQAAIEAAQLNSTKALKDHLKDLRKALKKEHADIDREDDDNKPKKPGLIDELAARVLDFDLKYVEKRVGAKDDG